MAKQVQTEATNLSCVEEVILGSATPPTTGWRNMQPNSYGNFGPSFKKTPRDPISKNQQLRKGMLVDEDSAIPFELDLTKDAIDQFGEAIFRCKTKHSGGTGKSLWYATSVDATGFVVDTLGALQAKTLVYVRGAVNAVNNGLHEVDVGSTGTHIKVLTAGLIAETLPANATVEVAGFRFASGDATLDSSGNFVVSAANLTTMGLNPEQWVYVGGRLDANSFVDTRFRGAANIVSITATDIVLSRRTWALEFLDLGTVSTGNIDTIVEVRESGLGHGITLQVVNDGAGAGTLTESLGAVVAHVQTGTTTVAQFEALINASVQLRVRTADATGSDLLQAGDIFGPTAINAVSYGPDAGTAKRVEMFFTRWYRNVPMDHADYKVPSFAMEVTYPTLSNGAPEYEYLLGNELDEWVWNFPLTGKATINASFVGTRSLNPTATRKTGPSTALDPNTQAGLSTSTDLQRIRVDGVDDVGISSDLQSVKVTTKNNISPQKQLGKLGARLMNQGKHTQMADLDVIFVDDQIIKAVKDNRDVRLDVLARNEDFGCLLDVQTMTLDTSDKKLEKDKSVMISSKATGHQNVLSTASLSVFAFLPPLPEVEQ